MATLLRANVNDMLDRAEDPEKMLNQLLRDMANQIQEARGQLATMMAQEKMLEAQLDDANDDVTKWEGRAERMVKSGNDEMAREALRGKQDAEGHVAALQNQIESQRSLVAQMRSQMDALQRKYDSANANKDTLIARYRRARTQQQMANPQSGGGEAHDYGSDLDRLTNRVQQEEALASAQQELATSNSGGAYSDFGDENSDAIESELAALKQKFGGGSGQTGVDTVKMNQ